MKTCFECKRTLPLTEFYRHPRMADGRFNKCKDCAKSDVKSRYAICRAARGAYDRERDRTEHRRRQRQVAQARHKKKHPDRAKARQKTSNAIRDGRLIRGSCRVCRAMPAQAHHPDYSRPLEVDWLCFRCHREIAHSQTIRT